MMGPVDEIKSRLDIVEFLKSFLKLEKAGSNWKALCPFHTEKSPSFFVSPARQMWYCFGCHKGGDAFKFLMELEHLEFPEVLKILAEKTGIELKHEDPRLRSERNRLLELLESATKFFQDQLKAHSQAYEYLASRGLADTTVKEFRLGFAPAGWENLSRYLVNLGYGVAEIEKAGLAIKRTQPGSGNSIYDRFRSRIMFPINDTQGRIVGFTGRIFEQGDKAQGMGRQENEIVEAKYVNTPESPVFIKSRVLYGFDKTKNEIRKQNSSILVEGQMDFLMAWQEGVQNAVATSGTALTPWHLSTLKRLCDNLYLAFDMDEAGSNATERSIAMATRLGFQVKIIELPRGKDIADFAKENTGKLPTVVASSQPVMEYYFGKALGKNRGAGPQGDKVAVADSAELEAKKKVLSYLLPRIKTLKSPVDQAFWLEKLSNQLGVGQEVLMREISTISGLLAEGEDESQSPGIEIVPQKERIQLVAERVLALALQLPDYTTRLLPYISYFPGTLQALAEGKKEAVTSEFLNYLGLHGEYIRSILGDSSPEEELDMTLRELRGLAIRKKLAGLSQEIKTAELTKNSNKTQLLSQEFAKLSQELSSS